MRVISGTAKGLRLVAPKTLRVRPALDKVKGAIFNILFDVEDRRVLDLFAGSGSIGIEALSRGAKRAVFVEEWPPAVATIYKNLEHTRLKGSARVMKMKVRPALRYLARIGEKFDLVFIDPPYLKNLVNPTLELIADAAVLSRDSVVIIEHHPKEPITLPRGLVLTDSRKYGQTIVSFISRASHVSRYTPSP